MRSTLSQTLFQAGRSWQPSKTLRPLTRLSYSTTTTTHGVHHIQTRMPPKDSIKNGHRFKEFDLNDRVYAITGGGRGLGLAMAEALMEAGAKGTSQLAHQTRPASILTNHGI